MSLADYVRDDLAKRLRTGRGLPPALTLDALAELYQVSFTPVRAAVAELIEDGLLAKGANRRLLVNPGRDLPAAAPPADSAKPLPAVPPTAATNGPPPPQSAHDAYNEIVDDLVQLSLQGNEIYLREESTADKYQMSRSAIRNVFHRLAGEAILDHIPRRGWRLRPFRRCDLHEFNEAREAFEIKALDLAWTRLDHQHIERLYHHNLATSAAATDTPLPPSDTTRTPGTTRTPENSPGADGRPAGKTTATGGAIDVDESLHEYIIQQSNNRYITDFFLRQGRYYRLLFRWEDQDTAVALDTIRQHQQILLAILNRDLAGAKSALSRHILHNNPLLVRQS